MKELVKEFNKQYKEVQRLQKFKLKSVKQKKSKNFHKGELLEVHMDDQSGLPKTRERSLRGYVN